MAELKWINTAIGVPGISIWQYVDRNKPLGHVSIDDNGRVVWAAGMDTHGTARSVGQGKRAVQKLVAK